MAAPNSFLFLPDISGFTRFVNRTEIQHSQHITAELLELLIDANELGLTLAEIEGDALFFYKKDVLPSKEALLKQVQAMFVKFHTHLKLYEQRRICQCGACCMAASLELKFVAHAGYFDFIQIKEHRKPYGKSIIEAHRLLKNDVPIDEYLLLSKDLTATWEGGISLPDGWGALENSQSEYGEIGKIDYTYVSLSDFQKQAVLPAAPTQSIRIDAPVSMNIFVDLPIKEAFELVSNFDYRMVWNTDADDIQYEKNRMNRLGTKHFCVIDKDVIEFETTTADFGADRIVYGEKFLEKVPGMKELVTYFILERKDEGTLLTVEFHYKMVPVIGWLILPILKRKISRNFKKMLSSFKRVAEAQTELTLQKL
ncbi:MAG: DUF2652 domain-containing protein [Chitinophagales bacterium]